jgi:hypothetical protein
MTQAADAAKRTVGLFPDHIPVSHMSAACWRDAVRMIGVGAYDLIAVAGLPGRRRERRALLRAAESSGTRLVYA